MTSLRRFPALPALSLVALLLTAGCAAGPTAPAEISSYGSSAWKGTSVTSGYPLPEQEFTDTTGRTVVPARDAGAPTTLVFFGYTRCPDICNIVLANIAAAMRGLPQSVRDDTRLLFVSTDPARDTRAVVREYLDRFDPSYVGLVAPVETVELAARALHISYERPDGSTGGYEVEHGAYTTGFVDGEARVVWAEDVSVADMRADIRRLVKLARLA